MRTIKYHTIGSKLMLAFASCTLLIAVISVVALTTWNNLDTHVNTILNSSVPTLNTSYQLENHSAHLQSFVTQIQASDNKAEHNSLKLSLNTEISTIKEVMKNLKRTPDTSELDFGYKQLSIDIDILSNQLLRRIDNSRVINTTVERLHWIHQDIIDELQPLRQELQWQLTRINDDNAQKSNLNNISEEFSITQNIMDKETALYNQIEELPLTPHQIQIDNAFQVIKYKLDEIESLSQKLYYHSSTIAYRQLLKDLSTIIQPSGDFQQKLNENVQLQNEIDATNSSILTQLALQHQQIKRMVGDADLTLKEVKLSTQTTIADGNRLLIICFSISLAISIFLTIYFVKIRIVNRLNQLSDSLEAINKGKIDSKITVSGSDEIGQIGEKLREFRAQIREMERTNALNLINNTLASIITCDLTGMIESVNPSAKKLFDNKCSPESNMVWDCFISQNKEKLKAQFVHTGDLHRKGSSTVTLFIQPKNKPEDIIYLRLNLNLFEQGHSQKVIITISDITEHIETKRILEMHVNEKTNSLTLANQELKGEIQEHRRTEQNLRDTQTELIQAAKMAVVGQAMTSMAHELNQPLSAISTYLFSAKMAVDTQQYHALPSSLTKIEELGVRMGKIIKNLRHFAKKHPVDCPLIAVDLFEVTEQASAIVANKAKRQQTEIINQLSKGLITEADSIQLEQIIINLLVNACDAVASEQTKSIEIVHLDSNNDLHTIAIKDSGKGFEPEIIESLFTPFTTTKEVGLGLGLSISRSIIKRFNGSIFLASSINGGAMIILELPKHDNK
ncbi:ATP-binding protein [Aliivibrio kagoshimensis]|uniref:ATP-binding protein n=1 Tax=Aliivibrio kagoshimensis TaxID=2910230 RepID=UPI003D13F527